MRAAGHRLSIGKLWSARGHGTRGDLPTECRRGYAYGRGGTAMGLTFTARRIGMGGGVRVRRGLVLLELRGSDRRRVMRDVFCRAMREVVRIHCGRRVTERGGLYCRSMCRGGVMRAIRLGRQHDPCCHPNEGQPLADPPPPGPTHA
jgi:hypothetical protein